MDITNPVILLRAENQLETPVEVDAVLTPMKGNACGIDGKEVKWKRLWQNSLWY